MNVELSDEGDLKVRFILVKRWNILDEGDSKVGFILSECESLLNLIHQILRTKRIAPIEESRHGRSKEASRLRVQLECVMKTNSIS
jgi:hypothetical protein